MDLLLFTIDSVRYGISSTDVAELIRAVAVTPLPGAPGVVAGLIDLRGELVPVFNLRRKFGLAPRAVEPADHFIIARTSARVAALHVDRVVELIRIENAEIADPAKQVAESPLVAGVAMTDDGLALIYDVDTFLSRAEAESLDNALASADSAELTRPPSQAP